MAARMAASAHAAIRRRISRNTEEDQLKKEMVNMLYLRRQEAAMRTGRRLPYQNNMKSFYDRKCIQIFVAALLLTNFLIFAVEAQYLPEKGIDDELIRVFLSFEHFFAYIFFVELLVNLYGSFFWEFWKSGWNFFDFFIVMINLFSLGESDLPGISVLRMFRAFRVVSLFKRVKTMRNLLDTILRSLPGMSVAFASLFPIVGIYGIIAVEFWNEIYPNEFGSFLKAMLSLFQIMTFDSWTSGIARKIIYEQGVIAAIFFITYVFIASIIMANIVVALLLENFMISREKPKQDPEEALEKRLKAHHEQLVSHLIHGVPNALGKRHSGLMACSAQIIREMNLSETLDSDQGEKVLKSMDLNAVNFSTLLQTPILDVKDNTKQAAIAFRSNHEKGCSASKSVNEKRNVTQPPIKKGDTDIANIDADFSTVVRNRESLSDYNQQEILSLDQIFHQFDMLQIGLIKRNLHKEASLDDGILEWMATVEHVIMTTAVSLKKLRVVLELRREREAERIMEYGENILSIESAIGAYSPWLPVNPNYELLV